jgi:hypothetical protein
MGPVLIVVQGIALAPCSDAAVLTAYGFSPKEDLLAQLLRLNLEAARREQAGETVTAPDIPPGYTEPARLVTDDCIRAWWPRPESLTLAAVKDVAPVFMERWRV